MKIPKTPTITLCAFVAALVISPAANAQFLNKLSKGLEKVNKGLEKVEKTLNGEQNKSESNLSSGNTSAILSAAQTATNDQPSDGTIEIRDRVPRPHFTTKTRFLLKDVAYSTLENNPVSEGIFGIPEYNRKYGYGMYYGFWTIDGRRLFEARYEQLGDRPLFDNGAAVVKSLKDEKGVQYATILYSDGSVRELPESYKKVSQFHDGIATVETGGYNVKAVEHFCINTNGERMWNDLGPGDIMEVGYLRDGLRCVKVRTEPSRFRYVTRWGFINNEGKWVIKPTLKDVREFKNGYALVIDESDKLKFIDTKGITVYEFEGTASTMQYAQDISDISDGYFVKASTIYDLNGNAQKSYYQATEFTDGYAFVRDDINGPVYVIDTHLEVIRTLYGVDIQSARVLLGCNNPKFGKARLGTIDKRNVVTPRGDMQIIGPTWPQQIGDFYPGEYAACASIFKDAVTGKKHEYVGYINRQGEYEVVFSADETARGPFHGPFPIEPEPYDSIPIGGPWPPLPPVDTIPQGPKNVISTKYKVRVLAYPDEGGKVVGDGEFKYGDTIMVGAKANKDWRISHVACSNRFAKTSVPNKFVVRGDMDIIVYFLKDDVVTPIRSGTYSGDLSMKLNGDRSVAPISIPIYLETSETSALETPYGNNTQGFLAVMINPNEKIVEKSLTSSEYRNTTTFTLNAFFVPMKVGGVVEDDGKQYMLLDGGEVKINNLTMLESGAKSTDVSALESAMVNLMMMFDCPDTNISGASYRVEMLDIDPSTGAFTLGMLQRIDPQNGWIAAGSDVFANVERSFFVTKVDYGLPADYFNGIRLTPSAKRNDVLWQPTPGFFENDLTRLERYVAEIGNSFRQYQSECDLLKGVTFKDFGDAFDRLMKMK